MSEITSAMIRELRERTQAGMSDCKNALVEATGDIEKAVEIILKKGIVKAAARAGRVATEGEIRTIVSADARYGTIVEINCQTDFVSRGDDFKKFVHNVAVLAAGRAQRDDLLTMKYPGTEKTVDTVRQELIAKTGENCVVRRWETLHAPEGAALVHAYVHTGGKLAVLVSVSAPNVEAINDSEFVRFADNCAMQIAAMSPVVVGKTDLSDLQVAKQKEIFEAQLNEENKPEKAWSKIIEGKLAKWYTEVTLLGQDRVWRDSDEDAGGTIDACRVALGKKLGGEIVVTAFLRFALGEGLEKKVDNLADEVAKLAAS